MLDERGGISTFGWVVSGGGRRPDQVGDDVQALVDWSTEEWKRHFPAERGYEIGIEPSAGATRGVHLTARRGDFRAEVSIEQQTSERGGAPLPRIGPCIRAHGRAWSHAVQEAHALGDRLIGRARISGFGLGVSLFVTLAWLMVGVNNPVYVLGGMLLVVALLLTVIAGGTLGERLGERLASVHHDRARQRVQQDQRFGDDVRRWKAVGRKLVAQRASLSTRRGQPFRRAPDALAS